jgi:ADP-ribose pyrophosphatase YjhB (NUDIX family)
VIRFDRDDVRFNFRVAGVAYREGKVLLQRSEGEGQDFWFLPGGRVEMLESATECLVREMREELGVETSIGRLLWVVESFFPLEGFRYHEIGLYFLIELPQEVPTFGEFHGHEADQPLFNRWFPLDALPKIKPSFLCTALLDPPATPGHVIQRD